ncbi:MAG: CRTAC1 family protein, partial [Pyrinomonadaceae bacterium]|nr:CRTAC1 family protein [Pyrinomonadaceae bacterium]
YRNSRKQPLCYSKTTARDYCGPKAYRSVKNYLFRNRGNGTFEDVSAPSGISSDTGHSLGVVTADLNADGWTDIYVANDGDPNEVWINKKNGRFENDAFFSGAAVNKHGKSEASMGVDAGDINLDGKLDLFITHLMEETHTLYVNEGDAMFEDITNSTNLGLPDVRLTGFGTLLFDFDNDGLLDVFIANGSVKLLREVFRPGNSGTLNPRYPLGQQNQLFRNVGKGIFEDVSGDAGGSFLEKRVSRGAAFGDVDNDGDTDILVSNNSGPAELLINRGNENGWIGFQLTDKVSGRDLLGARLEVVLENGRILQRRARTDGSYSSSHDPRVLVGLGRGDKIKTVRVFWPDGSKGVLLDPKLNSYNKISFDAGSSK